MTDLKALIAKVATGASLTRAEARTAFDVMMSGSATPAQIGGFLMALRVRGETVDEITGAVEVMREKMLRVATGGDGSGSWNVSTASAFVTAACGVPVAKHGNRALSSKSGAADVLMALGVKIDVGPDKIAECIRETGVGFMFAPAHHAAMKHVGPARVELGTRTAFNLLGPLSNPAGVKRQMTGVFARAWVEPIVHSLAALGAEAAWVVNGSDGLDEITVTGETHVAELKDGRISTFVVTPESVGLTRHPGEALKGGDAAHNAAALRTMLGGAPGAYRDIVLMNAGAALVVADKASTLLEGVERAARAIDDGSARARLDALILVSNA